MFCWGKNIYNDGNNTLLYLLSRLLISEALNKQMSKTYQLWGSSVIPRRSSPGPEIVTVLHVFHMC